MKRRKRRLRILLCTAISIEPLHRVVFGLVGVGVCGRGFRVHARVQACVTVEMGAARQAAALVNDRILRAGASLATAGHRAARRFRVQVGLA